MSTGGYPLGAQYDPNAPYNKKELPEVEIDVLVSITLSKTVKVKVSDYSLEYCKKDFSDTDLKGAVLEQVILPEEAHKWVVPFTLKDAKAKQDLEGWNVDEFEVILDN